MIKKEFITLNLMRLAYLLSYEGLEHAKQDSDYARKEANKAMNIARWSLWITAAIGIASIILQIIKD